MGLWGNSMLRNKNKANTCESKVETESTDANVCARKVEKESTDANMTKEELKEAILSGVNLDRYRRASMEQFINETDDLTIDNFMDKYKDWIDSGKNKKAFEQVRAEVLNETNTKIKVGINAISHNAYTPSNDPDTLMRFKMDRVRCNSTGLNGIITADGEEIVPCIFDYINIHLDGYIEAVFKGVECNFWTINREAVDPLDDRKDIIYYGKKGALLVNADVDNPEIIQLLDLLSK